MCDCYVTGVTDARKQLFAEVFDDGKVPIVCPIPAGTMIHEKLSQPTQFFLLDLKRITPKQRKRLIAQMAKKFELSEAEVEKDFDKHGVPVRWDTEVAVHWCSLHVRCIL